MPRFGATNPLEQDPERVQLVQTYMMLHAKQTSVRRRLSSPPSSSASSSPSSSGSSSPDPGAEDTPRSTPVRQNGRSGAPPSPRGNSQRSHYLRRPSVPSIPETLAERDIDSDEGKLLDINHRIKSTLLDLLNCESVRKDERMRSWVQSRLDAQLALNDRGRQPSLSSTPPRRRSSASSTHAWVPTYADGMRMDSLTEGEPVRKLSI
ncbi:hypothetical protein ANO11243_003910 [Dothideomycetidae sp. 11243]|nr:hypothetical protein ANO11243_003910 [fungal sp. No.11243]